MRSRLALDQSKPDVQFYVPTEFTEILQVEPNQGRFYVEYGDHTGENKLIIVNSYEPSAKEILSRRVGRKIRAFGVRDYADSHDFALLWLDGKTLLQETDAATFFYSISFRQVYDHAAPTVRECLVSKLGQPTIDTLSIVRNQSLTEDQASDVNKCFALEEANAPQ